MGRDKWFWIGLTASGVVAVLCCGAYAANLSGADSATAGAQVDARVGDPVRDGKFEFVVQKVQCGVSEVGGVVTKTAQGQFCIVTLSVRNIGDKPKTMSDNYQKGFGSNDARYGADSQAGPWLTEVNPGNQITGTLVFDLPQGVDLIRLRLHDSAFSGGVDVNLLRNT